MAMAEFFNVYIYCKKDVPFEKLEKQMNLSLDWMRITQHVWILYSTSDIDKWQERLRPLVEPDGSLFICRIDIKKRNGWMSKQFWDWINSKPES
jgi:hypothetical protein